MNTTSAQKTLTFVISVILVGILLFSSTGGLKTLLIRFGVLQVEQEASYGSLTFEEMVSTADVIFVGRLVEMSPSKWNQDNGEYWGEDAIQYHTLRFQVLRFIVNGTASGQTIEVTILGSSLSEGNQDYNLAIGDDVLVFAGTTDLVWREGGTKPTIAVMTDPYHSFFIRNSNGDFEGEALYSLGQGNFTTERITLPLADLTARIQNLQNNSTTP